VFAITAGAFVPMNFIAVRLSTAYLHPRVLGSTSNLPAKMAVTFVLSLLAIALLYATLCKYELTAKNARAQLRALRRLADQRDGGSEAVPTPPPRARSAAPSLHAPATMAARAAGRPGS
jgi:heme exporter protein C